MNSKYEKYQLVLQRNQIQVFNMVENFEDQVDLGRRMQYIVIGNAYDLLDIDFACYMSLDPLDSGLK